MKLQDIITPEELRKAILSRGTEAAALNEFEEVRPTLDDYSEVLNEALQKRAIAPVVANSFMVLLVTMGVALRRKEKEFTAQELPKGPVQ